MRKIQQLYAFQHGVWELFRILFWSKTAATVPYLAGHDLEAADALLQLLTTERMGVARQCLLKLPESTGHTTNTTYKHRSIVCMYFGKRLHVLRSIVRMYFGKRLYTYSLHAFWEKRLHVIRSIVCTRYVFWKKRLTCTTQGPVLTTGNFGSYRHRNSTAPQHA